MHFNLTRLLYYPVLFSIKDLALVAQDVKYRRIDPDATASVLHHLDIVCPQGSCHVLNLPKIYEVFVPVSL